jgi:hypothetical protein
VNVQRFADGPVVQFAVNKNTTPLQYTVRMPETGKKLEIINIVAENQNALKLLYSCH